MVSLGCSKNQVDAERLLYSLQEAGFALSGNTGDCDVVIINTCAFIEDAKKESIDTIFEFAAQKGKGRLKGLVVTGCMPERYREEFVKELPEVDVALGIGKNADIVAAVQSLLEGKGGSAFGEKEALSLEGGRVLANAPWFAYLKIAEGCDNRCSYCAIPDIRGCFRSRPMEKVLEEARELVAGGVRELNVVAQDTSRYGEDLYGKLMLPQLLTQLCGIEGLHWVRVLYCYPDRVTDELLDVMAGQPKIVPYMDLPLQHASGRILKAMYRKGDHKSLLALCRHIREKVPGIILRTTFITGFPGETQEDFETLCEFIRDVRFERLGCFAYSREEDTPAHDLPDQIDEDQKARRAEIVMGMQAEIACSLAMEMVGRQIEVLCEGWDQGEQRWWGRGPGDASDIDTRVYFTGSARPGEFVQVKITGAEGYDLIGEETASAN